jgi:hypothetical protein
LQQLRFEGWLLRDPKTPESADLHVQVTDFSCSPPEFGHQLQQLPLFAVRISDKLADKSLDPACSSAELMNVFGLWFRGELGELSV